MKNRINLIKASFYKLRVKIQYRSLILDHISKVFYFCASCSFQRTKFMGVKGYDITSKLFSDKISDLLFRYHNTLALNILSD